MTTCCKGCTSRKQGCHVGCEQAAVEDIVKIIAYSEDTNIFTPIRITDFNDTQAGMKQQGQEDAVNAGILEAARANAEVLIRGFLSGAFDLNEYELIFK